MDNLLAEWGNLWSWDTLRVVNFILIFISFVILVYRGVYKIVFDRRNFYWDRFMNLVWCFVSCLAIGQVLYLQLAGGWRVWPIFFAACLQLYIVLFRSPYVIDEKDIPDVDLRS